MACALSMSHTLNETFISFDFVSDKVFLCGNANASVSFWQGLAPSPETREVSLDLNGSLGDGRRGAIPHQQALSPPEVYEWVRHWDGGGSVQGCGQGNKKANGPVFQKVSKDGEEKNAFI